MKSTVEIATNVFNYGTQNIEQPCIVLVHGWGCSHETWRPQIDALAEHYRVIAVDLPGHGGSAQTEGVSPDISAMATWLAAKLSQLAISDVVLVGHSMGCAIVAEVALRLSEQSLGKQPRSIVLLDGFLMDWGHMRDDVVDRYMQAFRADFPTAVTQLLQHTSGSLEAGDLEWLGNLMRSVPSEYATALMASLVKWNPLAVIPDLKAPLYAMHSGSAFEKAADRITPYGVNITWLKDSGHFLQWENADAVTTFIRQAVTAEPSL